MGKENGARALVVDYDGIREIEVNDIDDMQEAVNGGIELFGVPLIDGVDLYIDDEGMFSQDANRAIVASKAMEDAGYLRQIRLRGHEGEVVKYGEYYTSLHGPILAVGLEDELGEITPLSDEQVEAVLEAFRDDGPMGPGTGLALETAILMEAGL